MEPVGATVLSLTRVGICDVAGALALKRKGSVAPLAGTLLQTQVVWGEPGTDSCPLSSLPPPHRPLQGCSRLGQGQMQGKGVGVNNVHVEPGAGGGPINTYTAAQRGRGHLNASPTLARPEALQSRCSAVHQHRHPLLALWPHPPLPSIPHSWPPLTHSPPPS